MTTTSTLIDWTDPKIINELAIASVRSGEPTIFVFTGRNAFVDIKTITEAALLAHFDEYAEFVREHQASGDMLDEDISPELRAAVAKGYRLGADRLAKGAIDLGRGAVRLYREVDCCRSS